jgi:hypothetical protein
MKRSFRARFWIEFSAASITALLCIITPFWPDWIEAISGWDPDQHDGSVEWMIAGGLLLITLAISAFARSEWKRTPAAVRT